ncbi:tetraacyldisaccharide 4'-kinase [uncultured Cohaesibacter sp.]|uniref:tetraacyldisaccharide 4'-kinase n=1 Tax=uncultured Cohaesibacter sp. TaxID=1002546 RepID=UPI00292FFF69|nr:tetraacyldisaccharide 4'-kinase [uncultured Cohaesibacter sp.]
MKAPEFWNERSTLAWLLYPVSLIYGRFSLQRMNRKVRYKAHIPVLCVGNLVMGGAGKTPTALALGKAAADLRLSPIFLTRGFKGKEAGPLRVDPQTHTSEDVGDEALLLAKVAPTVVARDRVAGAKLAEEIGKQLGGALIIMDDGFQNPYLFKDFNLVVVDAQQSIGNSMVFPAGPLRAPLNPQIRRANQLVIVGDGAHAPRLRQLLAKLGKSTTRACIKPAKCRMLGGTRVFAFCGIGHPDKFYQTLEELELDIIDYQDFDDHHAFTNEEAEAILERAKAQNLDIVTTSKDHVRLKLAGPAGEKLARKAQIIAVEMAFDDNGFPRRVLEQCSRNFSRR